MSTPDNPPAFPRVGFKNDQGHWITGQTGMTLRDWFAGQATEANIADFVPKTIGEMCDLYHRLGLGPKPENQECIRYMSRHPVSAKLRYRAKYLHADAMLAARESK